MSKPTHKIHCNGSLIYVLFDHARSQCVMFLTFDQCECCGYDLAAKAALNTRGTHIRCGHCHTEYDMESV